MTSRDRHQLLPPSIAPGPCSRSRRGPVIGGAGPRLAVGRPAGVGRRPRGLRAAAVAGCALAVFSVPSWLSESASAWTGEQSGSDSSASPSPEPSPTPSSPPASPASDLSCATSSGVIALPDPLPSGWSLPAWVEFSGGPRCAVLDVSSLRDTPAPPDPVPAPSTSPEPLPQLDQVLEQMRGLRSLVLYSAGIAVFCLGALLMRSRRV